MVEHFLIADIGGTNARFAIATARGDGIEVDQVKSFLTNDYDTGVAAIESYLVSVKVRPDTACLAAAGPLVNDTVRFTNTHWVLQLAEMREAFGFNHIRIVNDFYALASGVHALSDDNFLKLNPGTPVPNAPQLVIGPGTGFGQALIIPTQNGNEIVATEGGHLTFAPMTKIEREINDIVALECGRVSVERLLSGPGIEAMYAALCEIHGTRGTLNKADEITRAALSEHCVIARETLNIFCGIFGRVCGDAVLATGARGGVLIGGGISPKIKSLLLKSQFLDNFYDKGRLSDYLKAVPIRLIVSESIALLGAARIIAQST
ncbi:MAG: glucokinase [Pseudomonadota bacterium]